MYECQSIAQKLLGNGPSFLSSSAGGSEVLTDSCRLLNKLSRSSSQGGCADCRSRKHRVRTSVTREETARAPRKECEECCRRWWLNCVEERRVVGIKSSWNSSFDFSSSIPRRLIGQHLPRQRSLPGVNFPSTVEQLTCTFSFVSHPSFVDALTP